MRPRKEHGNPLAVEQILITELPDHLTFLPVGEQRIGQHDERKQRNREHRRPMHHPLAEEAEKETRVLRMAHETVESIRREPSLFMCPIELAPALNEEADAEEQERIS